ncbi:DNA-directed RNA polymerase subunit delta [Pontibacillus litoralis]|uniref:Probable DNA-directed RNA polymerase subunit delta n=1 Tax=Pontibacillus litoralis JSM 072002 TaxID=1385512 RepID=A0A0A5HS71_9BACI|nr:DNA-directed RNA polymerase subunit delta [Pontibacillus litoralis]KGX86472.1 hypothetical protein N784_04775 [Pontibacillus litoralis JSM 072002]
MSLNKYSHEEVAEMSMIEIANEILSDEKQALQFNELFNKIAELKGFDNQQKRDNMALLFTYMNTDGRFMTIGSNIWGLKRWYPVEQQVEEVQAPVKKKKKAKKEEELEEDIEEEVIEDDLNLDVEELDLDADDEEDELGEGFHIDGDDEDIDEEDNDNK